MWMLSEIFHDPALAIKNARKDARLMGPVMLTVFGAFVLYIALLVLGIKSFSTDTLINNFWLALITLVAVLAYAYLSKIPYEIMTDNKNNSFTYSLAANGMWFSMFSIGMLILAIFLSISGYVTKPAQPLYQQGGFYPTSYSYPVEYYVAQVISAIGLFVFLWFLMKGIATATRAIKELFGTDYMVVLVVHGITGVIAIVIYLYVYLAILLPMILPYMMIGKGL